MVALVKHSLPDMQIAVKSDVCGIFLIDKPAGPTSFRIVQQVRRALNIKKVGHSGTLDPFASGLLIICAGRRATKIIPLLMEGEKEYEATLKLGIETETHDPEGEITGVNPVPDFTASEVTACLQSFIGKQMQTPPPYSAVKHNGKPLYYYARQGIMVTKEPRQIKIPAIDCLGLHRDELAIRVVCSKGTYIRVLASDIGRSLGCGAHLKELRRTRNGPFRVTAGMDGGKLADPVLARQQLLQYRHTVEEVITRLG
jgi:tRNA pseudouridine55 synthase